jgi:hypothetical protein
MLIVKKFRVCFSLLIMGFILNGCYMPMRFDAEIEITRGGFYSMIFDGYIVKVPLYEDILNKKIKPADIRGKAEILRASLAHDTSMKSVKYLKQGVFQVHWEKTGDILQSKFVTFFQRNENMMSLRYVKTDGTVQFAGATPNKKQRAQLAKMGLDSQGQIRLITDAKVESHNANRVVPYPTSGPKFSMYVWDIVDIFTPSPKLKINLF